MIPLTEKRTPASNLSRVSDPDFQKEWKALLAALCHKSQMTPHLYPVEEDHCFARILLDCLFKDCWYNHLKKPATKHLNLEQRGQLLALGEELLQNPSKSFEMQKNSLRWRGKIKNCLSALPAVDPLGSSRPQRLRSMAQGN